MKRSTVTFTAMAVIALVLLSACSVATQVLPDQASNLASLIDSAESTVMQSTPETPVSLPPAVNNGEAGLLAAYEQALTGIYESVNPSVVNIRVVQELDASDLQGFTLPNLPDLPGLPDLPFLPDEQGDPQLPDEPQFGQGLGSGFIWDKTGHIITNNHVVSGADKIEVAFADGQSYSAELIGTDPDSDLAVLKIDAPSEALHPVSLADSSSVKVGQLAIAIGNPFGLDGTMTVGIVSALGRTLPAGETFSTGPTYSIPDIIQTDAPINPGNSGGVLVNDKGEVIGVTAAIESPVRANAGIGFVIPSNIVSKVVPVLIDEGAYAHPYLGITGTTLTRDLALEMGLEENQRGALVIEVTSGGPADEAGLRGSDKSTKIDGQEVPVGGDIITAMDGQPVTGIDDIIAYLGAKTAVGQKVELTILRDGEPMNVNVTLQARPSNSQQGTEQAQPSNQDVYLGIMGTPVNPDIAEAMGLETDQHGVLVQEVVSGSPADEAGLLGSYKPLEIDWNRILVGGDVITAVDGQVVKDVAELRAVLQQHSPGDNVVLGVIRDGEQISLDVILAERP